MCMCTSSHTSAYGLENMHAPITNGRCKIKKNSQDYCFLKEIGKQSVKTGGGIYGMYKAERERLSRTLRLLYSNVAIFITKTEEQGRHMCQQKGYHTHRDTNIK